MTALKIYFRTSVCIKGENLLFDSKVRAPTVLFVLGLALIYLVSPVLSLIVLWQNNFYHPECYLNLSSLLVFYVLDFDFSLLLKIAQINLIDLDELY